MPWASKQKLLLSLWAEAGRHSELKDTLPGFIHVLLGAMPLTRLRFFELLQDERGLMLFLEWQADTGLRQAQAACELTKADIQHLKRWTQSSTYSVWHEKSAWPLPFAMPDSALADGTDGTAVIIPFTHEMRVTGLAIVNIPAAIFAATDLKLFQELLKPLTVMVENDHRLREIQRLRAAAEADRQTLLARLGRKTLSETIIGADRGLRAVMQRVTQVAPTDASTLILGETGSGKEVIARAIHERSHRHDGPFLRVNCGALPPELIDSELFGHEKGSFTGAFAARRGWFERASGGTLFLDEIGELPPAAQVRLLRVLQDGLLQRVGSESDIVVDVRVVAATHRDLPKMVQTGEFREDLWYRLAVFPIILPALHERPEDIAALAKHFVQRAAMRLGVPVPPLSENDIERLKQYSWPGNVRELGAVLERAVILGHGRYLDLDAALGVQLVKRQSETESPIEPHASPQEKLDPLDSVIVAHLKRALAKTHGRVDGPHGAAKQLAVNPNTFRAKLRKYKIDPAAYREGP
jgi:transcriptional regulator with GAF, ATPase, and Fis domain